MSTKFGSGRQHRNSKGHFTSEKFCRNPGHPGHDGREPKAAHQPKRKRK